MPTNKPIRTFFILGLPRSGTTLLEQMLDQHTRVKVCPEMATGLALWRLNASQIIKDKWNHLLLLNYIYDRVSYFKTSMTECLADQAIREFDFPVKTTDWFTPVIRDFVNEKQADLYGEKTPENLAYIQELKKAFPGSKFILLLRHPMDVIYSIYENAKFIENPKIAPTDILKMAWPIIKRNLNTIIQYKMECKPEYLFVKYEDLMQDLPTELKRICDFLDIHFEPAMFDYQHKKEFSEKGKSMQKMHSLLNDKLTASRIFRSFQYMDPKELKFANAYFKDELRVLEYPSAPIGLYKSPGFNVRILWARAKYQLKIDLIDICLRKLRFQVHYISLRILAWLSVQSRLERIFKIR